MIKAIETEYDGVIYRSRLEARWAVFFDEIGIDHIFEYEGFDLSCGYYLPDFWLPELDAWLEIKPIEPGHPSPETIKCYALAEATRQNVYLAFDGFGKPEPEANIYAFFFYEDGRAGEVSMDAYYQFCDCPKCNKIGIEFEGRGVRVCGDKCYPTEDRMFSGNGPRFTDAHSTARKYRFR